MSIFYVNGKEVTVAKKQKLLRYLRDELRLTSVKDGCSEGACGACTVLIEGEPCRACIPDTERLHGKHVLTVEGLSDFEKAAYTFAFGEAGAVQCGFCIPGMVLCAKSLLDKVADPTDALPSAITTAAAPAMSRSSTPSGWRARSSAREKFLCPLRRTGASAAVSTAWTWRKRCSATANIPTTSM